MRKYKRKGPRPWRDKDKRMILAVRLRNEGKSLRQSARELSVTYETVRRDLARWDATHANVIDLSQRRVTSHPTAEALGYPPRPMTVRDEQMARAAEVLSDWR